PLDRRCRGILRDVATAAAIGIGNVSDLATLRGSHIFIATAPAPLDAKRCALAVIIASFVGFCALVPFARVPLPRIEAFIPISESIFGLQCLVTAGFLLVGFKRSRLRAVLLLASGYLFISLTAVPQILALPGLVSSRGLFGAGPETNAWLDVFRHGFFPLFVI